MIRDTMSYVDRPKRWAITPEMVYSPELYSFLAMKRPNSGKATAALSTAQAAAMPDSNAACATPMVDLAPMNSDIRRTPTTIAGMARAPTMNSSDVLLRNFTVSQDVNAI